MKNTPIPKEFNFQEILQNDMVLPILQAKSPLIKFKINQKAPIIRSNSDKTLKNTTFFDSNSVLQIKSVKDMIFPLKIFPTKMKEKPNWNFESFSRKLTIKEDNKIDMKIPPIINNKIIKKSDFKLSKVIHLYSECISDLDTKFSYFRSKIQKDLSKKFNNISNLEQLSNLEEIRPIKNKQKTSKTTKNKFFQRLKQEISKCSCVNDQNNLISLQKKSESSTFQKIFLRNYDGENTPKYSNIIIIHMKSYKMLNYSNFIDFLDDINEIFFIVLIFSKDSGFFCEKPVLSHIDAIFIEDFNKKSDNYCIVDYESIITEIPLKLKSLKRMIIISKTDFDLFDFSSKNQQILLGKQEKNQFDGYFPKKFKSIKVFIDLIYIPNEFWEKSDDNIILLQLIKSILNEEKKNSIIDDKICLLDFEKISLLIDKNDSEVQYLDKVDALRKNLSHNKYHNSNVKDSEILQEYCSFKRNILKNKKKIKYQKEILHFDLLKMISSDLIKRNIQYLGKILSNPLSGSIENELIFKKINQIRPKFKDPSNKKESNHCKFNKISGYFIKTY